LQGFRGNSDAVRGFHRCYEFQEHCLTVHELLPGMELRRHRILQGESRMFRQSQSESYSNNNKVKAHINTVRKRVVIEFN